MADLLNGLPQAIGAIERGEVVKATNVTYFRKHKWADHIEAWSDKIGAWTKFHPGGWDACADYEISTDPMKPAEGEKVEAISEV